MLYSHKTCWWSYSRCYIPTLEISLRPGTRPADEVKVKERKEKEDEDDCSFQDIVLDRKWSQRPKRTIIVEEKVKRSKKIKLRLEDRKEETIPEETEEKKARKKIRK